MSRVLVSVTIVLGALAAHAQEGTESTVTTSEIIPLSQVWSGDVIIRNVPVTWAAGVKPSPATTSSTTTTTMTTTTRAAP